MDIQPENFNKENTPSEPNSAPTEIMQKLLSSNIFNHEEETSSEEDVAQDDTVGFKGKVFWV